MAIISLFIYPGRILNSNNPLPGEGLPATELVRCFYISFRIICENKNIVYTIEQYDWRATITGIPQYPHYVILN